MLSVLLFNFIIIPAADSVAFMIHIPVMIEALCLIVHVQDISRGGGDLIIILLKILGQELHIVDPSSVFVFKLRAYIEELILSLARMLKGYLLGTALSDPCRQGHARHRKHEAACKYHGSYS